MPSLARPRRRHTIDVEWVAIAPRCHGHLPGVRLGGADVVRAFRTVAFRVWMAIIKREQTMGPAVTTARSMGLRSTRVLRKTRAGVGLLLGCVLALLAAVTADAQPITGVPGSPSATTTIDGKYLPSPPPRFGGTINLEAGQSKPYWAPKVVPPKGAPNVLLIMTDDQGYGVSGTRVRVHVRRARLRQGG